MPAKCSTSEPGAQRTEGGGAGLRGFETLALDDIVSIYEAENVASGRVMQRLGMKRFLDTAHPPLRVPLRLYRQTVGCAVRFEARRVRPLAGLRTFSGSTGGRPDEDSY